MAHQQVVDAHDDDAERDRGLHDPGRDLNDVERCERERDAVSDRERRNDGREAPHGAAEQQQPEQKQDVIGPDQDVLDAGLNEGAYDRPSAGRGASVVGEPLAARIEDRLVLELPALVDVDERLMSRIVGEQDRVDVDNAGPAGFDVETEPQALTLGKYLDRAPAQCCWSGIDGDLQAFVDDPNQSVGACRVERSFEQRCRIV